jgi:hypothetical protein
VVRVEREQARACFDAAGGRLGVRIDRDHFEIHATPQVQQPVVGAHQRMRAAAGRRDAERIGDVLGALVERAGGNHEVVESERVCGHGGERSRILRCSAVRQACGIVMKPG